MTSKIAEALALVHPTIGIIGKNARAYNYKYADFAQIREEIDVPLKDAGLSIYHSVKKEGEGWILHSVLTHSSGENVDTIIPLLFNVEGAKNAMQALGSAITYAKRYAVSCLLNLAWGDEDDDGVASAPERTRDDVKKIQEIKEKKAPVTTLSADQIGVVNEWFDLFPKAKEAFFKEYRVGKVEDIPAFAYDRMIRAFKMKVENHAKS